MYIVNVWGIQIGGEVDVYVYFRGNLLQVMKFRDEVWGRGRYFKIIFMFDMKIYEGLKGELIQKMI